MTTDRRAFLKRSTALGFAFAADEVLNAQAESPTATSRYTLANAKLRLQFDGRGLLSIEDVAVGKTFRFKRDRFKLEIDKKPIESAALRAVTVWADAGTLTCNFKTGLYNIQGVYKLRAGWRLVSKQILVSRVQEGSFTADGVEPLQFDLEDPVSELCLQNSRYSMLRGSGAAGVSGIAEHDLGLEQTGAKAYVAFLRMQGMRGLFTLLQNPFFDCAQEGQVFSLRYSPRMEWQTAWGPFPCDRARIGPYNWKRTRCTRLN
jgi:hypothetical protein